MKKKTRLASVSALLAGSMLALPLPGFAGQIITIVGDMRDRNVYGNSPVDDPASPDYGTLPNNSVPREPDDNELIVNSGTVGEVYGGSGVDTHSARGNKVTINSGGTVQYYIYGGYASSQDAAATVSQNAVTVSGTVDGPVYGGYAYGGDLSATPTANDNSVTIEGGSLGDTVIGGYASGGTGTASYNRVFINGGKVLGHVFGGQTVNGSSSATVTNNTVTISGGPVFDPTVSILAGGDIDGAGDAFTGNTLNLHSPITVYGAQNFQNLNFYLPADMAAGDAMLIVTGTAQLTENLDGTGKSSAINVGIDGASSPLAVNDKVILIDATGGTLTSNNGLNTTASGQGMQGVTLKYQFDIAAANNMLTATVTGVGLNEQAKALSEGRLASMALLREGHDLIARQGISQALSAAEKQDGAAVFAAAGYNYSRYKTGSHIDSHNWSMLTGLAKGHTRPDGRLTWGGFIEGGRGGYSSFNSFASGNVNGGGKTDYAGIGGFIRHDGTGNENGWRYNEGSVRMGRAGSDFSALLSGAPADYKTRSLYFGAHYGYGYIKKLGKATLDLYGKLLYTRLNSDSVTTASNDRVTFDALESLRVRLGAEYQRPVNSMTTVSYGLAYEYELDGKQKAAASGYAMDAPSLRGGSVVGLVGLRHTSQNGLFVLDLNLTGYAGRRDGVGFQAMITRKF